MRAQGRAVEDQQGGCRAVLVVEGCRDGDRVEGFAVVELSDAVRNYAKVQSGPGLSD